MTGDRFCTFHSNIFLCFSFWGVWEIYHTDWKDKLNNTETIKELSIYPTKILCDQICTYFLSSLFCSALTVFFLLAMLIIAGCRIAVTWHGVCSSQTKDQAIMFFLIKCSGVADQLLHQGDVLKDNWEWELSLDLNNWESGSLICSNNVCTRQNIMEASASALRFNLGGWAHLLIYSKHRQPALL